MSVVLETTYEGETFEVEVFHDGHIEFPDRDLRHEQAMAEFTDSESPVLQLYRLWKRLPTQTMFESFELPEDGCILLAADYAERVLHFYEDRHRDDLRPRNAIDATREFAAGKRDLGTLEKARDAAILGARGASREAAPAAWAAAWATSTWAPDAAAREAAEAAAYGVSSDRKSSEWERAYNAEVAWQVRRFVDVMEAVGQGFDPPDIGATP